jgi:hypothetical protein
VEREEDEDYDKEFKAKRTKDEKVCVCPTRNSGATVT